MDLNSLMKTHRGVRELTDAQWIELLVRSIDESPIDGLAMPPYPSVSEVADSMFPRGATPNVMRRAGVFFGHLKALLEEAGGVLEPSTRVLDVGCGWGRIYRIFLKDVAPTNLFGVDIDERLIDICKRSFLEDHFTRIEPLGKLPFPDGSIDLIFANSVLSHLAASWHEASVSEWARVLAPGGIVIATVLQADKLDAAEQAKAEGVRRGGWAWIHDFEAQRHSLKTDGFAWVPTGKDGDEAGYGMAFLDEEWLQRTWPDSLDVLKIQWFDDYAQSFAVGRKRSDRTGT